MADKRKKKKRNPNMPLSIVHASLGRKVVVITKAKSYSGILKSYDAELNLFLQNAEEIETERKFKKIIIKGGNLISVMPAY